MKKLLLAPLVIMVLLASGCVVPGTDIDIPFLPNIFGSKTIEYPNDVIVIKNLKAIPSNVIPGQTIRVSAYIQNIGNDAVPQQDVFSGKEIEVQLYDYCQGMFTIQKTICNGQETQNTNSKNTCTIKALYPSQVVPVEWVLKANKGTPLKTSCDIKIYAKYPYQTKSITSVTFINYEEMQRLMNEGKFKQITSYITEGFGPVKPYLLVEDKQPIPVQRENDKTVFSLQIKNKGSGFVSYLDDNNKKEFQILILPDDIDFTQPGANGNKNLAENLKKCKNDKTEDGLPIINKQTPKIICDNIPVPKVVPKQTTIHITTSVKYAYEFRKSVKVTVEPKT